MANTNMQFGGWYPNTAQGGKVMRYWGNNYFTSGEDPTGGRGVNWQQTQQSSQPSSQSASTTPNVTTSSFAQNPVQSALDIAKSIRAENIQAAQPAISTLQAGKEPLTARYDKILANLKAGQTTAVQQAGIGAAQEFGRRGIPTTSGAYDTFLQNRVTPVEQAYGGLTTAAEGELADKQAAITSAIASLQSGAGNVNMSDILNIMTTSKNLESQPLQLSEGQTLYNPTTGKAIYTAPKTYAPQETMDLSGLLALFGGGGATATNKPNYSAPAGTFSSDKKWYSTGSGWVQVTQ